MKSYFAIGIMSGTSLDGLDIAYVRFSKEEKWNFEVLHAHTFPYCEEWKKRLSTAIRLSAVELFTLNTAYGRYLGQQVQDFIHRYDIKGLDIIASHGHTVHHQPEKGFTVQIGDGRAIQQVCPYPVVYDFRSQDVILGGQGAPLVPIGDELLFSDFDACLNLGGFSNISFRQSERRIAFDVCPFNIVLNHYAQKLGKEYDAEGKMAALGRANQDIVNQLDVLSYYHQSVPKSLGLEWVEANIFPLLASLALQDALATFSEHIVHQLCNVTEQYALKKVLATGGGVFNDFIINRLMENSSAEWLVPSPEIIHFKEAVIFALMGVLRLRGENNVLASATGSSRNHCSGILLP